jgi:hypothetical protein
MNPQLLEILRSLYLNQKKSQAQMPPDWSMPPLQVVLQDLKLHRDMCLQEKQEYGAKDFQTMLTFTESANSEKEMEQLLGIESITRLRSEL